MRWFWIDKIVEFEPGKRARSVKNVTLAEEHLHDHYQSFPVMPESLMIEGMAQTGGILVGQIRNFKEKVLLAKIGKAKFYEMVRPGDQLFYDCEFENIADEAASIKGRIVRGETLIAEISMMFSHIDNNMAGLEFPEENFVFNEQFMNQMTHYLPNEYRKQ